MHPHMRPIKSGVPALNAMKAPQLQIPQTQQTQVHAGAQPSRNGHSAPNAQFSPSQSQPYGAARPPSPVRTNQASHLQTPRSQMQTGSQAQAMARGPQPGHQTGAHTQGQVGAKSPFASHRPAPPIHAQQPQLLPKPASSYGAWMESGGGGAAISTDWERGRASPAPFPKFHEEKTAGSPHLVASPAPMRITQAAPRHMVLSHPKTLATNSHAADFRRSCSCPEPALECDHRDKARCGQARARSLARGAVIRVWGDASSITSLHPEMRPLPA